MIDHLVLARFFCSPRAASCSAGRIPKALGTLTELQGLNLGNNSLSGERERERARERERERETTRKKALALSISKLVSQHHAFAGAHVQDP